MRRIRVSLIKELAFLYKIIVVDDEKSIRERLTHFLPWSDVGFAVVGTAENGREALKLIDKEQPTVVLTDVRMPDMTGLELAKQLKESQPKIKVVILSAYDDFKYAQDAIQYGVKGYLLKPLTKSDFSEFFTKLAMELKEDDELEKVSISDELWNEQELMILDLIKGENLHKYENIYNVKNQNTRVVIISLEGVFKETQTFSIRQKITETATKYWERFLMPVLFYGNNLILLISEDFLVSKTELKGEILSFVDNLQQNLGEIYNEETQVVVGVGNSVQTINEISYSYHEAVHASSYKFFSENEKIIFCEDLVKNNRYEGRMVTKDHILAHVNKIERKLTESVLNSKITEISDEINTFFEELEELNGQKISSIRGSCSEFIIMLIFRIKEKGFLLPTIDNQHVLGKIYEIDSLKELKRWLKQMIETIFYELDKKDGQSVNRYVLIAKEYVKENYREKISLIEMSNTLFLHQAYFSTIFKKETGQNFIDYVNEIRIEKATQLLRGTEFKVKMISDMVGFQSHSYFIKVFKNEIGVTPVLFRKQLKR